MRHKGLVTLVLATVVGLLLAPAGNAELQKKEASVAPGSCSGNTSGDFDNNDSDDLAIGVPGEDLKRKGNAGAVNVLYGASASVGLTATGEAGVPDDQFWHQGVEGVPNKLERGDKFGRCVTAGDFNGDGYADLAIGVPEENIRGNNDAGAVVVIYGSQEGLDTEAGPGAQFLTQGDANTGGRVEAGDEFGSALTTGDFDDDGFVDLAVGAPLEDNAGINSGAVSILFGSADGLTNDGSQYLHQDMAGVTDQAEGDDKFGASLASGDVNGDGVSDLAIGIPEENLYDGAANEREAGAVQIFYGEADTATTEGGLKPRNEEFWHQDRTGVEDDAEEGDNFGWAVTFGDTNFDGFDDLAVGVPFEDVQGHVDAGAVNVIFGSATGLDATGDQFWHQGNTGSGEELEANDFFGASIVSADFQGKHETEDLAIGIPGESVGDVPQAGAVEVLYGVKAGGLNLNGLAAPAVLFTQDTPDVENHAERRDNFGQAVAAGAYDQDDFADLAIGIPGENIGGGKRGDGAVAVIYATSAGLDPASTNTPDEFWHQDVEGVKDKAERNDLFGRALA